MTRTLRVCASTINTGKDSCRHPGCRVTEAGERGGMGMSVEKAKDFKGTMKTLWSYLSNYKFAIILVAVSATWRAQPTGWAVVQINPLVFGFTIMKKPPNCLLWR